MTTKPEPLVPAEVDLRGYEFMPYYGDRLRDSDLNSRATDAEYRAAHNLWWSAWKQVPAASLPNEDAVLCKLADLGRDLKTWAKVRERALYGFVLCADNRFYHRVLAVIACECWEGRKAMRDRTEKARNARLLQRQSQKPPAQSQTEHVAKSGSVTDSIEIGTGTVTGKGTGKEKIKTSGAPGLTTSPSEPPAPRPGKSRAAPPSPEAEGPTPTAATAIAAALRKFGVQVKTMTLPLDWAEREIPIPTLTDAVRIARERKPEGPIPAAYLAPIVEELLAGVPPPQLGATADPDRWWKTSDGIKAKGAEFDLVYEYREPGDFTNFKARVFNAAGDGPWIDERDGTTFRLVQQLRQQVQA